MHAEPIQMSATVQTTARTDTGRNNAASIAE
jgi:hypothetical protein